MLQGGTPVRILGANLAPLPGQKALCRFGDRYVVTANGEIARVAHVPEPRYAHGPRRRRGLYLQRGREREHQHGGDFAATSSGLVFSFRDVAELYTLSPSVDVTRGGTTSPCTGVASAPRASSAAASAPASCQPRTWGPNPSRA